MNNLKRWSYKSVFVILALWLVLTTGGLQAQDSAPVGDPAAPTDVPTVAPTELIPATDWPTLEPSTDIPMTPTLEPTLETPVPTEAVTQGPTPSLMVTVPAPVETMVPAEPPMSLLVREMLDNGDLSPWALGAGWALAGTDSGLGLQAINTVEPARLLKGQFYNLATQARFASSGGSVVLSVRQSPAGSYSAVLDPLGSVQILRAGYPLQIASIVPLSPGSWHVFRLSAVDGVVRVMLDGFEVAVAVDEAPLPPGEVTLGALFNPLNLDGTPATNVLLMDDFFLWVPTAEIGSYPQPTPVTAPTEVPIIVPPTVEPTPVPATEMPVIEPTIVLPTLMPTLETPSPEVTAEVPTLEVTEEPAAMEPVVEVTDEPAPTEVPTEIIPEDAVLAEGKDFSLAAPPSQEQRDGAQASGNDNFANAVVITDAFPANADSGDSTLATLESGEILPSSCGFNVGYTVWFKFIPSATASYTISTAGSSYDTVLAIYTGSAVNALTQIACNDDASIAALTSRVTATLTTGLTYYIQIGGYNGRFGNYSILVQRNGLTVPTAPVLTSPINAQVSADTSPTLNWNPPANAAAVQAQMGMTYHIQIAPAATFAAPVEDVFGLGSPTYTGGTSLGGGELAPGTYFWRVQALNGTGIAGPFSAARTFIVKTVGPTLTTPLGGATVTAVKPKLMWAAWAAGATYDIQIDADDDFIAGALGPFQPTPPTGISYITNTLQQGTWYWRARANASNGYGTSNYSTSRSFTINLMILPANNAIFATAAGSSNVTFRWYAAGPTATGYRVEVDDDPVFGSINQTVAVPLPALTTTVSVPSGVWYWRVVAEGVDVDLTRLPSRKFTVSPLPPAAPAIVQPNNGWVTPNQQPTLEWGDTAAPAGGPFTYEIQVARASSFALATLVVNNQNTGAATDFTPASPLPPATYFWRVRTVNSLGIIGPYSPTRSFVVKLIPPVPAAPANSAVLTNSKPALAWTAYSANVRYDLQLDNNSDFSSPEFTPSTAYPPAVASYTPGANLPLGTYFWRVRATDTVLTGSTDYGPSRSFTINILLTPVNDARINGTGPTSVTFTWAPVLGAANYTIQVDDDPTFASPLVLTTPNPAGTTTTESIDQGQWYWRIFTTLDTDLTRVPVRRFWVSPPPLPAPALVNPTAGKIFPNRRPLLDWNPVVGAAKYQLQIATNAAFTTGLIEQTVNDPTTEFAPVSDLAVPPSNVQLYYWRVRTLNGFDLPGPFSPPRTFTVRLTPPILSAPVSGAILTNSKPTLTWAAYGAGAVYDIRIDNNADCLSPEVTENDRATASFPIGTPLAQGTWYWCVRAKSYGGETAFSAVRTFTIAIQTLPANSAILTAVGPSNVTFRWAAVPLVGVNYTLEYANNSSFAGSIVRGSLSTTAKLETGLALGDWYWRVYTALDTDLSRVPVRSFKFSPVAPAAPVLATSFPAPSTGMATNDDTPEFRWSPTTTAVGGPFKYELQVSINNTFAPPLTALVLNITAADNLTGTSFTPGASIFSGQGTYYWRMRTVNTYGRFGPYSPVKAFVYDTTATSAPLLISPNDSATVVQPPIPAFRWSRPVGAVRYEIQLGTSNPPGDITSAVAPAYVPPSLLLASTYYWRVRAFDLAGNPSGWSSIRSVKVATASTAAPLLNRFGGPQVSNPVKLTWAPISWTNPGGKYQIQVDDHSNFSSPITGNLPDSLVEVVTGTQFITEGVPGFPILANGTWYWRVRACPAAGACGAWSTTGSFTVER